MQTLVAPAERVLESLTFHCAVQFARNLVDSNPILTNTKLSSKYANRTKAEYPDVVRRFAQGIDGSCQEIIKEATENAIAWISEKERRNPIQVRKHFEDEANKLHKSLSSKYPPDILEKQITFIEYLVLKPLSRFNGGET